MGARNCFYLRERNTQGGWRREERSDTGALIFSLPTGPFFLLWKERLSLTSMAEFSETKVWKKYSRFSPFFLGRKLKLTERDWLWMPLRELNNQSTPSPSPSQPVFICWHMPKASFCPWCTFSPRLSSLALYTCMTICYVISTHVMHVEIKLLPSAYISTYEIILEAHQPHVIWIGSPQNGAAPNSVLGSKPVLT